MCPCALDAGARTGFLSSSNKFRTHRVGGKYAVAVYAFEVVGGDENLGRNFANAFESALSRSERLTLIDRRALDKLLEETHLTLSGVTANPQALRASNIDILIYSSINLASSNDLRIDCKFLDTSTAQILSGLISGMLSRRRILVRFSKSVPF